MSENQTLTPEQYEFLLYMEQTYWKRSLLPTLEQLKAEGVEVTEDFYLSCWTNPAFVANLKGRGLPDTVMLHILETIGVGDKRPAFSKYVLTEQQMTVANMLLDVHDSRARVKKLTEAGVSLSEFNAWLKDPAYQAYCRERAEQLLLENQSDAHIALIGRVRQGDLGAIKYFNAITGRFAESRASGVTINNNFGSELLRGVVEVIQRHVKDPETLRAIADDILVLQAGHTQQSAQPTRAIAGQVIEYG